MEKIQNINFRWDNLKKEQKERIKSFDEEFAVIIKCEIINNDLGRDKNFEETKETLNYFYMKKIIFLHEVFGSVMFQDILNI